MITHPTFTDYIIFRDGKVMNKNTGKVLKSSPDKDGYWSVRLRKDKKSHNRGVHRLILQTYNPIENDHLYHAHHIDEVRHHNHIGNLRWELSGEHIREHHKGVKRSEETRRKMSESQKGHLVSDETRRKIGEAHKGKVLTEEHKRKMSESHKGKVLSKETRRKISEAMRNTSDETRRKMSESHKGNPLSEEHKRRIGEAKKGALWWNNGTKTMRSKECPGEGWTRGRCKVS